MSSMVGALNHKRQINKTQMSNQAQNPNNRSIKITIQGGSGKQVSS